MKTDIRLWFSAAALALGLVLWAPRPASAADTLNWRTNDNRVSANFQDAKLPAVLERMAYVTGWQIFFEPSARRTVTTKFRDVTSGEALHLLLGDLNYAIVPQAKGPSHLYVFRTSRENATQRVDPSKLAAEAAKSKIIPNELVVRLKPGAKIDDLARLLGAKVVGRIDSLNAYRLRFDTEEATDAARTQLAASPDVASVENNFSIDRPPSPDSVPGSSVPPPHLTVKPPPDSGRIVVGLVDTAVQPLGNGLDAFLQKQLSAAGDSQLDPNAPSHGTSMAETMLRSLEAVTKGSTSVQILPVDVFGPNANTSTFDLANGIAMAVNKGANPINLSLGSESDSALLHQVIQDASAQHIVFITAAGNDGKSTPFYPAAYPETLPVTAIDNGQLASYANRATYITLGAPGTSIVYFNNQPYVVQGTSPSAAFISGMASGYMDLTHSGVDKVPAFLQQNFGIKIVPAK